MLTRVGVYLQGAVVGSSLGRFHWPGSRRTLEGSASVFLSTLATLVLVSAALARPGGGVGESEGAGGWWVWEGEVGWGELAATLAWPAALVSLMEAFTTQVLAKKRNVGRCSCCVSWFLFWILLGYSYICSTLHRASNSLIFLGKSEICV